MKKFTLYQLNKGSPQDFVAAVGGAFERSP